MRNWIWMTVNGKTFMSSLEHSKCFFENYQNPFLRLIISMTLWMQLVSMLFTQSLLPALILKITLQIKLLGGLVFQTSFFSGLCNSRDFMCDHQMSLCITKHELPNYVSLPLILLPTVLEQDPRQRVTAVKDLIRQLPKPNQDTMQILFRHLKR